MYLWLDPTHAHMALVDLQSLVRPFRVIVFELVSVLDVNSIIAEICVLACKIYPGWNPVFVATVGQEDMGLNLRIVRYFFVVDAELPQPKIILHRSLQTFLARYSILSQSLNSPKR